jgi:hypothetical protein
MQMKSSLLFVESPRNYWFVMGEYLPPPSSLLILAAYIERELPGIDIEIVDCQADHQWFSPLVLPQTCIAVQGPVR